MDNIFISKLFRWDNRSARPWHRIVNKVLSRCNLDAQLGPRSFTWGMANVEARMNLFHLASQCAAYNVQGDFVELGCNAGESSVVIQKIISSLAPEKELYCYDSFEGLPDIADGDAKDSVYEKGSMRASLESFQRNFKIAGLKAPQNVVKGFFDKTIPQCLPDKIAFALLDCDLYESTKFVLPHVYSRMTRGAICMFGVYFDEEKYNPPATIKEYKSPGARRAGDEFFLDKAEKISVLYANEYSNGYFRKM